uniref:NRF domain-containing protein n=1 Tax=Trichuris muris TaxID=70415 RepID=A0A5S6Q3U7_TRIMR
MCSYLFFVLAWLLAHRQPQCSADEQFSWNLLSHHLSILRSSLLRNLSAKATEYGRRWLASPHESNPIGELIRLVKLLYEKLNSACEELKNSHGYKIDDQCRQDVALSVCAMAYLLNGTATKVFKICEADMDKQRCYNETNKLIYENMWAIRFVDAFGKIPSGIFDGNLIFLGSYAECVKLDVPRWEASSQEQRNGSVGGRNCIVQLGLPPLTDQWQPSESALRRTLVTEPLFKWGICVPSTCKASDIEYLGDVAVPGLASAGMRVHCEEYSPLMDDACAIAAITVGALLLLLVIVASVFDFSRQLQRSKTSMKAVNSRSSSPNAFSMDTMNEEQGRSKGNTMVPFTETDGRKISLLLFFSIFTNIRRLSRSDNAHLHYLDGVRCLSMMYAILGYTCMFALNNLVPPNLNFLNSNTLMRKMIL